MARDKVTEIRGIVRNTKDSASVDGECDEVINLRFKDKSWRPVGTLKNVEGFESLGMYGYERLFVHTNEYRHLFGVKGGDLYWIGNFSDGSVVSPFLAGVSGVPYTQPQLVKEGVSLNMRICQTGHLMVVIDGGLSYYLYRPYAEKYDRVITDYNNEIDYRLLPYGNVEMKVELECADDGRPFVFSSWIDSSGYSGTKTNAEKAEVMKDVIYKTQKDIAALNRFWGAFLACTAAELYDGTFILMSQPSLMLAPNVKSSDKYQNANIQYVNSNATTSISSTWARYNNINQNLCDEIYNYFKAGGTQTGVLTTSDICNDVREGRLYYFPKSGTEPDGVNDEILPIGLSETDYNYNQELITDANFKAKAIDRYLELKYGWSRLPNTTSDSYPVIKNTKHEVPFYARWSVTDDATECFHFANKLRYRITSSVPAEYKDVIKNISVFVTPQAQMLSLDNNVSYGTTAANLIYDYRTIANITKELMGEAMMYKIGEIKTEDFGEANVGKWVDLKIEDGVLTNLLSQERLVVDANGRNSYNAKVAFPYNNRLHIADYVEELFHGWLLDHFFYNEGTGQYAGGKITLSGIGGTEKIGWIKVTIDDNGTQRVVVRDILIPDTSGSGSMFQPYVNHKEIRYLNPLLSYPDKNAKKMEIYIHDGSPVQGANDTFHETYTLTAHDFMNFAYYITPDLKPIDTRMTTQGAVVATPAEENSTEAHHNRLKVSKTNNALYFPYETVYSVGNGKIVGMAANELVLATGQIGDAPLYVFCSDGVYGLFVDMSGELAYNFARVLSEYVCNNGGGVFNIHGGVMFPTDKGYVLLEGMQTRDVTDKIEGAPWSVADEPKVGLLTNHDMLVKLSGNLTTEDFREYIKGCVGGYNFADKEIWLVNKQKGYSYIIDREGMFVKRTDCGVQLVNDFPRTYLLDVNQVGEEKHSTLRNLLDEEADTQQTMFLTRAIKNDTQEFKQTERLVMRGEYHLPDTKEWNKRTIDLTGVRPIPTTSIVMKEPQDVVSVQEGSMASANSIVPQKNYRNHIAVYDSESRTNVVDAGGVNIDIVNNENAYASVESLFRVGAIVDPSVGWKKFGSGADDVEFALQVNTTNQCGFDVRMRFGSKAVYYSKVGGMIDYTFYFFDGWEGTCNELGDIVDRVTARGKVCYRSYSGSTASNYGLYTFTYNVQQRQIGTQETIDVSEEIDTRSNYRFAYIYLDRSVTPSEGKLIEREWFVNTLPLTDRPCCTFMAEDVVMNKNGIMVATRYNNMVSVAAGNNTLYLDEGMTQSVTFSATVAQVQSLVAYLTVLGNYNNGVYGRAQQTSGRYNLTRNTYVRLSSSQGLFLKMIYYTGTGWKTWAQLMAYPAVTVYDKDSTCNLVNGMYYHIVIGFYSGLTYNQCDITKKYTGTTGSMTLEDIYSYKDNPLYFADITAADMLARYKVLIKAGEYIEVRWGSPVQTAHIHVEVTEVVDGATLVSRIQSGYYPGWAEGKMLAGLYLFGSYDNKKWALLGARERGGDFRDLGLVAYRTDCKYFRLLFVGQLKSGSSIEYIEQVVSDRVFRAKIR